MDEKPDPQEAEDNRGRSVFALTPEQIKGYRTCIQILGWNLCGVGVVLALMSAVPIIKPILIIGSPFWTGVGYVMLAAAYLFTGYNLIRLNPKHRASGLLLCLLLIPFFPIGSAIALCGVFWLGKRGGVMNPATQQPSSGQETGNNEQAES